MSVLIATARPNVLVRTSSTLILAGLALLLGAIYVWVVQPGLPYDEPSHWSTVLFYAHHARMPVLGRPGVTYEAQMGPVAYVIGAVLFRLAHAAGFSVGVSFHLVRMLGVAEFAVAVVLVGALTRRLLGRSWACTAAVAIFALNPMLLAMSGSVQNDTLAIVLGLLALELALVRLADRPTMASAVLVGIVAGLALLTKLTAWAAVAAIAAWLVWRHRRAALRPLVAFLASVAAVSGWWFVRNVELYGDPTAAAGVHRTGVSFGAYHAHGVAGAEHVFEEFVTYLWLPTEYVRNLISAPTVLKGALLLTTVAVLVAGLGRLRLWREPALWLILCCGVFSLASWLVTYLADQAVAPRVAYLVLPIWVGFVVVALARLPRTMAIGATTIALASLNAWTLYELAHLHPLSFIVL